MFRFAVTLFLSLSCGSVFASGDSTKNDGGKLDQPNIILVMTDDQGYGDLSCHGHPFLETPNLDLLYEQSMRFTDFQVSPTCAPTRAALMSGLAPFKNGVTHTIVERDRMALSSTTIAEVLKSAGYTTGIFGKWHLGDADPYQPENRGFDETFIHGAGGIGQKYPGSQGDAPGTSYFNPIIKHNGSFVQTEGYCTDVFFQQALGWIKEQSTKTDEKKPFFAYIPTNAPHSPYHVDKRYSDLFKDKCEEPKDAFLGMIVNIDENMGLLTQKLDEWELANNTLLIFMTDNGSAKGSRIFNAGMRGGKGTVNEGGTRVPLFMRLPGVTTAGSESTIMTRHYDIFPTLAEIAGAEIPEDLELDGRSLIPLINDPNAQWQERYFFFHTGRWAKGGLEGKFGEGDPNPDNSKYKSFAVRDEKWRVVNRRLYDLENDPGENEDVSEQHPEVVEKMVSEFDAWWEEVRPLMVNEDAPLDVGKPFREQFKQQKESKGIPLWSPANIDSEAAPEPTQPDRTSTGYDSSVPDPTISNVSYGDHRRHTLDFWQAESNQPTPLVFVIHGGGWRGGSSRQKIHKIVDTAQLLENGISVASIHYRLMKHAQDVEPPVKAPMEDAARALQFVRSKSADWNIDKNRIGAAGGSAGGCSSLWIGYHSDLADPNSDNPIARESSRPNCLAVTRPQTTLDPVQMQDWISNSKYGAHAFKLNDFDEFLNARDEIQSWIDEYSPYAQLSQDDPPTYLYFTVPPAEDGVEKDPTHSAIFGVKLKERCDELGVDCEVVYPDAPE